MPGAQPRRGPVSRVAATARRGANVPTGVPGVYRVPRSRVRVVQSDAGLSGSANPWIQDPDYELVIPLTGEFQWQTLTPILDPATRSDALLAGDVAEGVNLSVPPDSNGGIDTSLVTYLQFSYFDADLQANMIRTHTGLFGEDLVDVETAVTLGAYFPPVGDYEFEAVAGTFAGSASLTGQTDTTTDDADGANPAVAGSLLVGQTSYTSFRATSDIVAEDTELAAWGPTATLEDLSVDTTAEALFGPSPESGGMFLTILNSGLVSPGVVLRPASGPPSGQGTAVATVHDLTLSVMIRPARYRNANTPALPAGWIPSGSWIGWVWDAGLYLQPTFEDMIGFPDTLPAGCDSLEFYVVTSASVFTDGSYDSPGAYSLIAPGGPDFGVFPPASSPDAGSHLWLVWRAGDQPTVIPDGLVPAALAADGTG